MNRFFMSMAMLTLISVMLIGCSGSSNNIPSVPGGYNDGITITDTRTTVSSPHMLWGMYHVSINPDTMTAEVLPLRSVEFTVNVTQFLQPPISPTHRIQLSILPGSVPANGYFEVRVAISHPFPSLPFYNGFDVRGILMANGSVSGQYDNSIIYTASDETNLLNADGWTRWWNSSEFTSYNTIFGFTRGKLGPDVKPSATLNPYKYFTDDLNETEPVTALDLSTRGKFTTAKATNAREYYIQFGMSSGSPDFAFNYAVDASWDAPDPSFAPDYPVDAFSLSANVQEAFNLTADFSGSTAYYVDNSDNGGMVKCALEVFDWGALSDEKTVPDEISAIWVESPTLIGSPVNVLPSAVISDGSGIASSVFSFELPDVTPTSVDNQWLLVTVESSDPDSYMPQITGGSGFVYPDSPLAAYMFFEVPINDFSPDNPPDVVSIVPNYGYLDFLNQVATISGSNFSPQAVPVLIKNDNPTIQIQGKGISVSPLGDEIDCYFDLKISDGVVLGLYNLRVTNNDTGLWDQLNNAYEVQDPGTCDTVHDTVTYKGTIVGFTSNYSPAFTKDGKFLCQANNGIYSFNVSQNGSVNGTPYLTGIQYGNYTFAEMESCDLTENIVYMPLVGPQWGTILNSFFAYKKNGTFIGVFESPNTNHLMGMDTDEEGGVWVIGHSYTYIDPNNHNNDNYQPNEYFLNRFAWNPTLQTYEYDAVHSTNITAWQKYTSYDSIYDIACSYSQDKVFVYSYGTNFRGRIDVYDYSSGQATHPAVFTNLLPATVGGHGHYQNISAGDIEIDHTDLNKESCRIIVMSRLNWTDGSAFVKVDFSGNVLDTWWNQNANAPGVDQMLYSITIANDPNHPDKQYVVGLGDGSFGGNPSDFFTHKMPPGW